MITSLRLLTVLAVCLPLVAGHGYIIDPPGRSSMWRVGFNTPKNYNDNQLFCGGAYVENSVNGGKCGVCGDPWNGPRENEAGGKYATGIIGKTYKSGQSVTIRVIITANHIGWFEFKICPNNNPKRAITQECLDSHVLQQTNGKGSKYYISTDVGPFEVQVLLPEGMTCTQCVLQWRYHTGNSWGVDPDGRSGLGYGPQEEFYGCSDIAITGNGHQIVTEQPTTVKPPPFVTIRPFQPIETQPPYHPPITERPYQPITERPYQPIRTERPYQPLITERPPQPITERPPQTESPIQKQGKRCYAVNNWSGIPSLDRWCVANCAYGNCPPVYCRCE